MIAAVLAVLLPASDIERRAVEIVATPAEEKWMTIPWRFDLTTARRDAQAFGKPIFMWIMNGHPMGCT